MQFRNFMRRPAPPQTFGYRLGRCPIDRKTRQKLKVNSVLLGVAALNLPPAFVYRLTRAVD